jgi:hypothetical protein
MEFSHPTRMVFILHSWAFHPDSSFLISLAGDWPWMFCGRINEIVNSDTGRQPSGAALPCEGELQLSELRSGGTPASLLSSRHLSCRSIRGPGLLDGRAEDLPH